MKKLTTVLLGAMALAATSLTPLQAATISAHPDGCATKLKDCYSISITGDITRDDAKNFEDIIKAYDIKNAVVTLNSDGGLMLPGLLMGLTIHEHKFSTFVPDETYCMSMCAAMWVAGSTKYGSSTAKIGFHQPYSKDRKGHLHVDPRAVALMKSYYLKVGVPKPAADFFVAANPKDIYWLNGDLAAGFKIDVSIIEPVKEPQKDQSKVTLNGSVAPVPATLPKAFIDDLANAPKQKGKL